MSKRATEGLHEHRTVQPLQIQNDKMLSPSSIRASGNLDHILTVRYKPQGEGKKLMHTRQQAMTCRSRNTSLSNKPFQRPGTPITGTGKVSYSKSRSIVGHHAGMKQLKESPFGWSYANSELASRSTKRQNGSQQSSQRPSSPINKPEFSPLSSAWGENCEDKYNFAHSSQSNCTVIISQTRKSSAGGCSNSSQFAVGNGGKEQLLTSAAHFQTLEESSDPEPNPGSYDAQENAMVNILSMLCNLNARSYKMFPCWCDKSDYCPGARKPA